jgi:dihydroorotase-like cyclic amidohydrolase
MSTKPYDLVLRGGTVATSSAVFPADVAIDGETIAVVGRNLPPGAKEIDARGKLVLPGGVDSHAHIEQVSAAGILNADTFESATVSAAFGGTTTVISFAAQHIGLRLDEVVDAYHALARKGAVIDYAFHMIIADPTEATLRDHLPKLVKAGHATIKVFMTYDRIKLDDMQLLDVLYAARENRALVCVHAENHAMISWTGKRLVANGYRAPRYHGISHPRACEAEAFNRVIALAAFIDQPIMIFHVSSAEGAARIRQARGEGLKVFAAPTTSIVPGSKARNGYAARRCAGPPIRRLFGRPSRSATSRPCRRITRPIVSMRAANSSTVPIRISRPSRTACRDWKRGCRCCSTPWCRKAASGWRNSCRLPPPSPRRFTGCIPARARSSPAPTPTSRSGIPAAR